jgi:ribonuclease P protein component
MLKKQNRLTKKLFSQTKKNKLYEEGFFSFRFTYVEVLEIAKASCVVSKKVEKKAVNRNKIKRRVYSVLCDILKKYQSGFIVVVYPKKNFLEYKQQDFESVFNKKISEILNK